MIEVGSRVRVKDNYPDQSDYDRELIGKEGTVLKAGIAYDWIVQIDHDGMDEAFWEYELELIK